MIREPVYDTTALDGGLDVQAVLALKRAVIPNFVGDEQLIRAEWNAANELHRFDDNGMSSGYCRIAKDTAAQQVHVVELLGPMALMRPLLKASIVAAWTTWPEARTWRAFGRLPDAMMRAIVRAYDGRIRYSAASNEVFLTSLNATKTMVDSWL